MSQFSLNPESATPPAVPSANADSVRAGLIRSYLWMTAGLLISMATAWIVASSGLMEMIYSSPVLAVLLVAAQFGLVFGCSAAMRSSSATLLSVLFLIYALVTGLTLSSIFALYADAVIWSAFAVSALYFGCLVLIGLTTKIDLSRIGTICLVGLIVMVITFLVMTLLGASMSMRLYSILGLILFTGITAWDNQRLARIMVTTDGMPIEQKKWSIYFALELYLDFINIFLYVLRLLSAGSSSRK